MPLSASALARECRRAVCPFGGCIVLIAALSPTTLTADALAECRALSDDPEDVNVCLDNYLGDMDDNMQILNNYIEGQLDEATIESFRRAQLAFADYRRENCLWYFEFSTPRSVADQLAKSCLARMTQSRLTELQALLIDHEQPVTERLAGYYVYGADRNSFAACGSGERYWVAGDRRAVGGLQQDYVAQATADRQRLYALVSGELVADPGVYPGHAGRLDLDAVHELRVPTETDCRLPESSGFTTARAPSTQADAATEVAADESPARPASGDTLAADEDPEQQLRAYFGEWQADCAQYGNDYECRVSVAINLGTPALTRQALVVDAGQPRLTLVRQPEAVSRAELSLPGVEIEEVSRIRWRIDELALGIIARSEVQREGQISRQIIDDPTYLAERLIPELLAGVQLGIELVERPGDASGQTYVATLIGVTRALAFAEDFVSGADL